MLILFWFNSILFNKCCSSRTFLRLMMRCRNTSLNRYNVRLWCWLLSAAAAKQPKSRTFMDTLIHAYDVYGSTAYTKRLLLYQMCVFIIADGISEMIGWRFYVTKKKTVGVRIIVCCINIIYFAHAKSKSFFLSLSQQSTHFWIQLWKSCVRAWSFDSMHSKFKENSLALCPFLSTRKAEPSTACWFVDTTNIREYDDGNGMEVG